MSLAEKKKKKATYLNKKGRRQPHRLREERQRKEKDRQTKGGRDRDGDVIEKKARDRQGRSCETSAGNNKNGQYP